MNKSQLVYLASPYMHKDKKVMEDRVKAVNLVAGNLIKNGQYVFSPISHCYPIAQVCNLPEDWNFWEGYDRALISVCKKLLVLKLDGWESSVGVNAEIKIAKELGIPIEYIEYKNQT